MICGQINEASSSCVSSDVSEANNLKLSNSKISKLTKVVNLESNLLSREIDNGDYRLSASKSNFLKNNIKHGNNKISLSGLLNQIKYYKNKLDIDLSCRKESYFIPCDDFLNKYKLPNENINYGSFLRSFSKCDSRVRAFLKANSLNSLCDENLLTQEISKNIHHKSEVDKFIAEECCEYSVSIARQSLAEGKCFAKKSNNQYSGYFSFKDSFDKNSGIMHIETLIFNKKGECFNIIPYGNSLSVELLVGALREDVDYYYVPVGSARLGPQATSYQCGHLGLASVKECLKNNAELFRKFSLKIKTETNGCVINYILPPPVILKYAQSSSYCEAMKQYVENENDESKYEYKGSSYFEMSLNGMIMHENAIVKNMDGQVLSAEELLKFKQKWLNAYEKAMKVRSALTKKNDSHNYYLHYRTYKTSERIVGVLS